MASFDFSSSVSETSVPVLTSTTNTSSPMKLSQSSAMGQPSIIVEDTFIYFIEERDNNMYYKALKRTFKNINNNQIEREQIFWIGDFVQFLIPGTNMNREGRIISLYSCNFLGGVKNCQLEVLVDHLTAKVQYNGDMEIPYKEKRRFQTNMISEMTISSILGKVFIVNSLKEMKERCRFYVENDSTVNTIQRDAFVNMIQNNESNNSNNNFSELTKEKLVWCAKENTNVESSPYIYYQSCTILGNYLSIDNLCTVKYVDNVNEIVTVMGRVHKLFHDKTDKKNYISLEEFKEVKKDSYSFRGTVVKLDIAKIQELMRSLQ
ncbi:hypothetical protein ABK040_009494 [Willaertia magna]